MAADSAPGTTPLRSPLDIGTTGASWVSEAELEALVVATEAALRVADHPFGSIDPRDFYKLRDALAPFRRGE